tara:strand:- start:6835 stop:7770 length:936 start_codon:yes stop_codon:yes gene_type:complete
MSYIFTNILGTFIFNEKIELIDKILFKNITNTKDIENSIKKLTEKHTPVQPQDKQTEQILNYFKNNKFSKDFYKTNLELTIQNLKDSVQFDTLLIQSVNAIGEIDTIINKLSKVLREWYELYLPELSKEIESHEEFSNLVLKKSKKELLTELKSKTIGADISDKDLQPIKSIAKQLTSLFQLKDSQEDYITSMMEKNCPNISIVATPLLGAKLISEVNSLKRFMELPASTVQILGAEKALFRHLKTGAKMPKHGIIIHHPLVSQTPYNLHGKVARALADKISIAARVDYFKGEFVGDNLKKTITKKFKLDY